MTAEVITVGPDYSAQQCMQIMTDRRVRHLPVVDDGRVLGMLSIGDLVRAVLAEQAQTIEQLENYIHHWSRGGRGATPANPVRLASNACCSLSGRADRQLPAL